MVQASIEGNFGGRFSPFALKIRKFWEMVQNVKWILIRINQIEHILLEGSID